MTPKEFLSRLDHARIVEAIAEAERKTSGEIRVFVSHHPVDDALAAARQSFSRLAIDRTRHRNGVLIFLAPLTQQLAIVGDVGVDEKCGESLWRQIADSMTDLLRRGKMTEAVLEAIETAGAVLTQFFPRRADDWDPLPDKIVLR